MFTWGQVNITVFRLFRKWKIIDAVYLWQENSTLSIIHSTMCAKHCDEPWGRRGRRQGICSLIRKKDCSSTTGCLTQWWTSGLWCWVWVGQVQEGLSLEVVTTHWMLMDGNRGFKNMEYTMWASEDSSTCYPSGQRRGKEWKWTRKGTQGPNQHGTLSQDVRQLR